jgi:putative ABC transport system permease protein
MNNHTPPRWIIRFLQWFCPSSLLEEIEGDLLQKFHRDLQSSDHSQWSDDYRLKRARRKFVWNAVRFFRPEILWRRNISGVNQLMIRNYVKVASRNIQKRKLYAFINTFGLSISVAFCILIYLFIRDERSFDEFHENKNRIFRLESHIYVGSASPERNPFWRWSSVPDPLIRAIRQELPQVQYSTRFLEDKSIVNYRGKVFTENIHWIDKDFFKMFSFPMVTGSASTLFSSRKEIVLTSRIVRKYFGSEEAIGRTMLLGKEATPYVVTAIVEDPPNNSSLDFDVLLPAENWENYEAYANEWGEFSYPFFIQLSPEANHLQFKINLDRLVEKYRGKDIQSTRKSKAIPESINPLEFKVAPLSEIHWSKEIEWWKVSDPQYSWILTGLAVVILIIACINYVSLALTSSASRKTEVGIRKVVGAARMQLIVQFLTESLLLTFLSLVAGVLLVIGLLPFFNEFTGKAIGFNDLNSSEVYIFLTTITVSVGIVAGIYPAILLSGFRPALVLKSWFISKLNIGITRSLVLTQFVLSSFMIICAVVMLREMQFIAQKHLGYDKSNVIILNTDVEGEEHIQTIQRFKSSVEQFTGIISMTGTSNAFYSGLSRNGFMINGSRQSCRGYTVDADYLNTLGITLLEGRNFDTRNPADQYNAIIVNETFVRDSGWENALGQSIKTVWEPSVQLQIIGVVKDFHYQSFHYDIQPLILAMNTDLTGNASTLLIKVSPEHMSTSIHSIQTLWKELLPDMPFEYSLLEQEASRQYESYQRWTSIMTLSTVFAVIIACLGLFGLAGINTLNRTKEISIRKILGASVRSIFLLLNTQYVWLSIIAFVVAAPFSWWAMQNWLADFKYHVDLNWELFVVSMIASLFFAILSVSYHTMNSIRRNPADTLKYE